MAKITFMGAGSSIFVKNVLGDSMHCDSLKNAEIALYDIDAKRLKESQQLIEKLNQSINNGKATITAYNGVKNRKISYERLYSIYNNLPSDILLKTMSIQGVNSKKINLTLNSYKTSLKLYNVLISLSDNARSYIRKSSIPPLNELVSPACRPTRTKSPLRG